MIYQYYYDRCVSIMGIYQSGGQNSSAAFTDPEGYESDPHDTQMQKKLI